MCWSCRRSSLPLPRCNEARGYLLWCYEQYAVTKVYSSIVAVDVEREVKYRVLGPTPSIAHQSPSSKLLPSSMHKVVHTSNLTVLATKSSSLASKHHLFARQPALLRVFVNT